MSVLWGFHITSYPCTCTTFYHAYSNSVTFKEQIRWWDRTMIPAVFWLESELKMWWWLQNDYTVVQGTLVMTAVSDLNLHLNNKVTMEWLLREPPSLLSPFIHLTVKIWAWSCLHKQTFSLSAIVSVWLFEPSCPFLSRTQAHIHRQKEEETT